jgi:hypothetical protein
VVELCVYADRVRGVCPLSKVHFCILT